MPSLLVIDDDRSVIPLIRSACKHVKIDVIAAETAEEGLKLLKSKQPDVLMLMFLYNGSFSREEKLANYAFYEPRTIHESSLSPSVHSILAIELGRLLREE